MKDQDRSRFIVKCMSWADLQCKKDRVGFASQSDGGRALLDRLERVLDLVQAALRRKDSVIGVVGVPELQWDVIKPLPSSLRADK